MRADTLEALGWLDEAEALLDQAHSNLRAAGLYQINCGWPRNANVAQLREDVAKLRENIFAEVKEEGEE